MIGCSVDDVDRAAAFGELRPDVFVDGRFCGCVDEGLLVFGVEDDVRPQARVGMF